MCAPAWPAQEEAKDGPGEGQLADRLEVAVTCLKQVYSECPSYDQMVPALLQHGLANLKQHCHFVPGVPVAPMLAKPTTGVQEVLTRFDKVCARSRSHRTRTACVAVAWATASVAVSALARCECGEEAAVSWGNRITRCLRNTHA